MSQKRLSFLFHCQVSQNPDEWDFLHLLTRLHSQSSGDERYAGSSVKLAHPTYRTVVMFRQLRKTLVATLIAAVTVGQVLPAFADSSDSLPDMGTTAGSTLSIGQEMQMGDYYVRQLRGSAPLINDP
ncbi:MAG: hypothetical protein E6543_18530, partial [Enterobacter hormaechei]|nr:hypothetical protein [Enterobacter hormaechei]